MSVRVLTGRKNKWQFERHPPSSVIGVERELRREKRHQSKANTPKVFGPKGQLFQCIKEKGDVQKGIEDFKKGLGKNVADVVILSWLREEAENLFQVPRIIKYNMNKETIQLLKTWYMNIGVDLEMKTGTGTGSVITSKEDDDGR